MSEHQLITLPDNLPVDRLAEIAAEVRVAVNAVLVSMGVVDLSPEFHVRSEAAVKAATACKQVQSTEEESAAAEARKGLRGLTKELEAETKALKKKLDDAGSRILALKKKGLLPLEVAQKRLDDMLTGYAQEKVDAERKAAAERARLEQEAQERAEELRRQAEAVKAKAEKTHDEDLEIQAQLLQDEADMAALAPVVPVPSFQHATGIHHRMVWDYEIHGDNETQQELSMIEMIKAGFGHYFEIKPRKSVIQDALKTNPSHFDSVQQFIRCFERPSLVGR